MGVFSKIFGKKDPIKDAIINEEIKKVESGEIHKIYPILKPGDWIGLKYGAVKKIILGSEGEPKLVVGYGYDAPENFIFLNEDNIKDKNLDDLIAQAFHNLDEYKVNVNEVMPGKVAIIDGLDFCSEKILSKKFMFEMHELLGSKKLLASIPRRRCMMITSAQDDPAVMKQFRSVHEKTWGDDSYGNAPIINLYFDVNEGEIVRNREVF